MRRAHFVVTVLALSATLPAPRAAAQAASEPLPQPLVLPAQLAHDAAAAAPRAPSRSFFGSTPGRLMTGAVIGGWLGYFASHVATSDWNDASGNRLGWAAGGMVLGGVTGLFTTIRLDGPARRPADAPPNVPSGIAGGRSVIEHDEIRESGAANAFELVRSLRKEWLIPRGINSFTESARGRASLEEGTTIVPGADHVQVYLNNSRLGGTQTLQEIALSLIERIEFIPGSQATFRWGTGHAHGVILLTTRSAEHP